jgi:hypothetical protein
MRTSRTAPTRLITRVGKHIPLLVTEGGEVVGVDSTIARTYSRSFPTRYNFIPADKPETQEGLPPIVGYLQDTEKHQLYAVLSQTTIVDQKRSDIVLDNHLPLF